MTRINKPVNITYTLIDEEVDQRKELSHQESDSSWYSCDRNRKTKRGDPNNCQTWNIIFPNIRNNDASHVYVKPNRISPIILLLIKKPYQHFKACSVVGCISMKPFFGVIQYKD